MASLCVLTHRRAIEVIACEYRNPRFLLSRKNIGSPWIRHIGSGCKYIQFSLVSMPISPYAPLWSIMSV